MNIELTEDEASMFRATLNQVCDIERIDKHERHALNSLIALLTPPPPLPEPTKFGAVVKNAVDTFVLADTKSVNVDRWRGKETLLWYCFDQIKNPTLVFEGVAE